MIVAGVDEAGRGALAGPIVACCVVFKSKFKHKETLNDSKKLSETKRETIFRTIKNDIYLGIGLTSNKTIDQINVLNATMLAMKKAINKMNIKTQPHDVDKISIIKEILKSNIDINEIDEAFDSSL